MRQGIFPPTARALLFRDGTIANTHFLGIPFNAPNPAGVSLLRRGFNDESIGAVGLFLGALAPTAVAAALFLFW